MASNGSCFTVTWIIFENHLLEVGLTQNWETKAFLTLTTADLLYFIIYEKPAWIKIHWNSIWLRARSHMTSPYTWGSVTTLHDLGDVLGRPLDTFPLGSHNFMVTAFGSCVKWPLDQGMCCYDCGASTDHLEGQIQGSGGFALRVEGRDRRPSFGRKEPVFLGILSQRHAGSADEKPASTVSHPRQL